MGGSASATVRNPASRRSGARTWGGHSPWPAGGTRPRRTRGGRRRLRGPGRLAGASGRARGGPSGDGPVPPRRDVVSRGRVRVVSAVDCAVVQRPSRGGRVRGLVGPVHPRGRCLLDGRGEDAMTGLDVLLAVAGGVATLLVIAGMILITPRGQVDMDRDAPSSQGSDLSRTAAADPPAHASGNA